MKLRLLHRMPQPGHVLVGVTVRWHCRLCSDCAFLDEKNSLQSLHLRTALHANVRGTNTEETGIVYKREEEQNTHTSVFYTQNSLLEP